MTNEYEEFATRLADRDIKIIKGTIDMSYNQVGAGQEPSLHDILMNFNILSSEEYQLSDSENAFIYATILKMSEITKFKLPKVTSFITITEDAPN